jgi:broad specificity phosphatase PhoE
MTPEECATSFVLVRHGETDWNRQGRSLGQTDVPLNATGRRQAAESAGALAGERFDAVYSSDLARAMETAVTIAGPHGLSVRPDPGLREVDLGEWAGLTDAEIATRFPGRWRRWTAGEGTGWTAGEPYEAMSERVCERLTELARAQPGHVLVVGHKGTLIAALARCERVPAHRYWARYRHPGHTEPVRIMVDAAGRFRLSDDRPEESRGEDRVDGSDREGFVHVHKAAVADAVRQEWCDVLGLDEAHGDDDFFSIGGDSQLALTLAERVEGRLGIAFPLEVLFVEGTLDAVTGACESVAEK